MQTEHYLRPLQFRAYRDTDFEQCLAIWRANEGRFFPIGYEPTFTESLRDRQSFCLLGESGGEIVGCGSVGYHDSRDCAWLSFGMIAPQHHRRGFGTTLLFARLALLEPPPRGCTVAMEVTPHSFAFYRRFGFEGYDIHTDERGNRFGSFTRNVFPADVEHCQEQLAIAGATLPSDYVIPMRASRG